MGDLSGTKGIFENYNGRPTFTVKDLPLFWVNKEGTRFVDEGVVYDNVLWGNAAYSVGGEYFAVLDQATVDKLTKEGSDLCGTPDVSPGSMPLPINNPGLKRNNPFLRSRLRGNGLFALAYRTRIAFIINSK